MDRPNTDIADAKRRDARPTTDEGELPASRERPLIVDLDDTLVRTDLLVETLLAGFGRHPWKLLRSFSALADGGRAALKARVGASVEIDVEALPYREELLAYLRQERERGRELALVSASNHELVERVARHLQLFDWWQGSTPDRNLKGSVKAAWLAERLPDGFAYAGDSRADLEVWRLADGAIPVAASAAVIRRLGGASIETRFDEPSPGLRTWARALRLHQWSKNVVILIPLFLSGEFLAPNAVLVTIAGFLLFSLVASAGYIINDLLDIQADRQHPTKRLRPLPAGELRLTSAGAMAALCLVTGLGGMIALSATAGALLLAYLLGTLAYSFALKRYPFVDLVTLASLFTVRLAVGIALIESVYSTWLLAFSLFFFFSLSAIKRSVELRRMGDTTVLRRGYRAEDLNMVQSFGVACAIGSLIIFVLYLEDEALVAGNYPSPEWLWLAPPAILIWLCRLWATAARGELQDDPVVFALRDSISRSIVGILGLIVFAAHLL